MNTLNANVQSENEKSKKEDNDFLKPGDKVAHSNKKIMDSPELEKVAETVLEKESLDLGPATIGYHLIYPNHSKYKAGRVKKTTKEEKHETGVDYWLQFSGETWDMLDYETRERAVYHLLLQINPVYSAKKQEWKMKTRKPDFRGFYDIDERYGNGFFKTIQSVNSSLYDLSPTKEQKVSI